jgi:cobalt-zinc-cadmium efflux system protein
MVSAAEVGHTAMTREMRLGVVLGLNIVLIAGLVIVGVDAHSLAVLAAGADFVVDSLAIAVSLGAIAIGRRHRAKRSGRPAATALAAFANGSLLLILMVLVIVVSVRRLASGTPEVHGVPVVVVSSVAAVVMLIGALVLKGDHSEAEDEEGDAANMRAVLLDTTADAVSAAGAAIAGAIIAVTGALYWLDPAVAVAIAVVVSFLALRLLASVGGTLRRSLRSN